MGASSPITVRLIRKALDGMDWVFTPFSQEVCALAQLPARFAKDSIYSAVVYNEKFGARMSLPVINQLGHTSMSGLLIHEALRHVEIAYQDGLPDETIRRITARIILSNPQPGETLDHAEWFGKIVGNIISNEQSYQALHDSVCEFLASHSKQVDLCVGGHVVQRTLSVKEVGELEGAVFEVLLQLHPFSGAQFSDAEKADMKRAMQLRDELTWEQNGRMLADLQNAALGMVDPGHDLNNLFVNMTEDHLRKYLSGDHSDFNIFQQWKMNGDISDAQKIIKKALAQNTLLSCPAN